METLRAVPRNAEVNRGCNRVHVRAEEDKLPSMLRGTVLYRLPDVYCREVSTRILQAISDDDKQHLPLAALSAGDPHDIVKFVDCPANRVVQCGVAPDSILFLADRFDGTGVSAFMQQSVCVVKQDRRQVTVPRNSPLLGKHVVEPGNGFFFEPGHRAALVEDEDKLSKIVLHKCTLL